MKGRPDAINPIFDRLIENWERPNHPERRRMTARAANVREVAATHPNIFDVIPIACREIRRAEAEAATPRARLERLFDKRGELVK